jgi:hypothetical protein
MDHEADRLCLYEWADIADMLAVDACIGDVVALMRVEKTIHKACCSIIREHLARSEERYAFNNFIACTEWRNENGHVSRYCDRPAYIYADGDRAWYMNGEAHRVAVDPVMGLHLPTFLNGSGSRYWWALGRPHRNDVDPVTGRHLPSSIRADGRRTWYVDGRLHRDDVEISLESSLERSFDPKGNSREILLPAIIRSDGTCEWYRDGEHLRDMWAL